jgi:hypothetical protein
LEGFPDQKEVTAVEVVETDGAVSDSFREVGWSTELAGGFELLFVAVSVAEIGFVISLISSKFVFNFKIVS